MKYLTLFSVKINHGYYPDGRCPDFRIETAAGTGKTLQDFHCLFKPTIHGLQILVQVDGKNKPLVSIPKKTPFRFYLYSENPALSLFTDLEEIQQTYAPLYTNTGSTGSGKLGLTSQKAAASETFTVQNPSDLEAFSISRKPAPKTRRASFHIQSADPSIVIQNYNPINKIIQVDSSKAAPGTTLVVSYPIIPRNDHGALAAVEIKLGATSTPGPEAPIFTIDLQPRLARWKYYILTDSIENSPPPIIQDKDKLLGFDPKNTQNLTQNPDPTDSLAEKLAGQYPNKLCFRLISDSMVPCQQAVHKNLQLFFKEQQVIPSLPNPALENFSVDNRNATQEYTLYQVVNYFSN